MDILKGYIFSITTIANKILLKTIKINIKDCLFYMPKKKKKFKPLLAFIAKLY